jgi:hypothetical protein
MATLVLGTAGRLIGGPIGGIIGTTLGGVIDSSLFASGRSRGGRQSNLAVQSAAYGEPIAIVTGRLRVAGNLLWSSGIKESTGGGGKSSSSTYSYTASFAVGLTGRAIVGVARIWADGRLIRGEDGQFLSPITMRLHAGDEAQQPDPLIAAFEGETEAPAYRGIAYVVFEDMPLADYGNRIPNLTFEVLADDSVAHHAGHAIAALARLDGRAAVATAGSFPALAGHFAGQSGSVADAMAPLLALSGGSIVPGLVTTVQGTGGTVKPLAVADCHARLPAAGRRRDRRKLLGGERRIGAVEVSFYDLSRDYQLGVQRVQRDPSAIVDQQAVPCAMAPDDAKALAAKLLARSEAARWQLEVQLPWRHMTIRPGESVSLEDQPGTWRIRQVRFESFIVHLELEREPAADLAPLAGDGGRATVFDDGPVGETTLVVLELPALPGESASSPGLWMAAAGSSPAWRRAPVEISADGGESYQRLGMLAGPTPVGEAMTALGAGPADYWDTANSVDVELLSDTLWLESRSAASILAGANLALLGSEVLQYGTAELLAPRRFRLSGLLRGRLGTEAAIPGHAIGERFVLLDRATMLPFDPSTDSLGRAFHVRSSGAGDLALRPETIIASGRALRPLSPAHLTLTRSGGDIAANWIRRSRKGFGWTDFVDAPLAEASEAYRVEVHLDGRPVRTVVCELPHFVYTASDRVADGDGHLISVRVAQLSAIVGPGTAAEAAILIHS